MRMKRSDGKVSWRGECRRCGDQYVDRDRKGLYYCVICGKTVDRRVVYDRKK